MLVALLIPAIRLAQREPEVQVSRGSIDSIVYAKGSALVGQGQLPGRDFFIEYPPLAPYLFHYPAALFSGEDPMRHYQAWVIWMGVLATVATGLGCAWVISRGGSRTAWIICLTTVAALVAIRPMVLMRYDLIPAIAGAVGLGALLAARENSSRAAAILAGAAIAFSMTTKVYAVLWLPLLLLGLPRALRIWGGGAAAVVTLPTLILAALGPANFQKFLSYQTTRGLEINSIWAAVARMSGRPFGQAFRNGSIETVSELETPLGMLATVTTVIGVVLPLALWAFALRRGSGTTERLLSAAIGSVAGLIAFNRVGCPQYGLWLIAVIPLAVLAPTRRMAAMAAGIFVMAVLDGPLLKFLADSESTNLTNGAIVLRTLALLFVWVISLKTIGWNRSSALAPAKLEV